MHVKFVALARRHAPVVGRDVAAAGSVDAFAVPGEPFAHLPQPFDGRRRQFSVGLGTDVEQQVSVAARSPHEVVDQRLRRFVVEVGDLVAPHAVHRLARFERQAADLLPRKSGGVLARKVAFENLDVLAFERNQVVVVTHQTGRPDGMDMVVQSAELPIEIRVLVLVPHPVEPHGAHRIVTRQQFRELAFHKIVVTLVADRRAGAARSQPGPAARAVVAVPVDQRIIEVQADALTGALVGERFHDILFIRRGVHDVVVRLRGVPHRKAVVVARREADVPRTRGFDGRDPLRGIEIMWIKRIGQLGVLPVVDVPVGHRPFARAEHGVKSPVEENAEFGVLKRRPGLQVFRRRGIGRSRLRGGRPANGGAGRNDPAVFHRIWFGLYTLFKSNTNSRQSCRFFPFFLFVCYNRSFLTSKKILFIAMFGRNCRAYDLPSALRSPGSKIAGSDRMFRERPLWGFPMRWPRANTSRARSLFRCCSPR